MVTFAHVPSGGRLPPEGLAFRNVHGRMIASIEELETGELGVFVHGPDGQISASLTVSDFGPAMTISDGSGTARAVCSYRYGVLQLNTYGEHGEPGFVVKQM